MCNTSNNENNETKEKLSWFLKEDLKCTVENMPDSSSSQIYKKIKDIYFEIELKRLQSDLGTTRSPERSQ